MHEKDLNILWHFTLRIGMYTGKENRDTVLSFIHGYEIGRQNECNFIEKLVKSIECVTNWVQPLCGFAV